MNPKNPYKFRLPIRERDLLVGRSSELGVLHATAEQLVAGDVQHVGIEAPPSLGKTSLLNIAEDDARELGLLCARIDISTLLFDADIRFFRALLDSVLVALAAAAQRQDPDRDNGEDHAPSEAAGHPEPEAGPRAAATFECSRTENVSPPLVQRDFGHAVELARESGHNGLVFYLDDAHYLFEQADHAVLDLFDALLRGGARCNFVVAGEKGMFKMMREHSFSLFQRFRPLTLDPILDLRDVAKLIQRPGVNPDPNTLFDLMLLSMGDPYWMTVAAHEIWAERDDDEFKLSTYIIRKVTGAQRLAARDPEALNESLAHMDAIDSQRLELVEGASRLAPYANMTVQEYVLTERLARIADGKPVTEELESALGDAEEMMDQLVSAGLLKREEDRFQVVGDLSVRTYLRYEAARRTKEPPIDAVGHSSYGTAIAPSWLERLAAEMPGVLAKDSVVATFLTTSVLPTFRRTADEEVSVEGPLKLLHTGADERDPVKMAEADFVAAGFSIPIPEAGNGSPSRLALSYVGILFEVGIDADFSMVDERVACGWLRWSSADVTGRDCRAEADKWLADREDELRTYRLRIKEVFVGTVDPDIAEQAVALMAPGTVMRQTIELFQSRRLGPAADYLKQAASAFERGRESNTRWRYEALLPDTYIRLGFISALLGRTDDAWDALTRAEELDDATNRIKGSDLVLRIYNLGYVRALRGQYAAAADCALRAADAVTSDHATAFMLLYLPTPADWSAPNETWNTTSVDSEDLKSVVLAQARCYEALSGKYSPGEFAKATESLDFQASGALRVLAWTWLTRFNDASKACSALRLALEQIETDPVISAELEFAERRLQKTG